MLHLRASSIEDTHAIAASVAGLSRAGDLIVLAGEMGAGKTAFAQGFGAALGVTEPMTSPTFTLVHSYTVGRITLHHADIYRLTTRNEVDDLALSELLEYDGIVLMEWGDVVAQSLGEQLMVRLQPVLDDELARSLTLTGSGRSWASRWDRLEAALVKFRLNRADSRDGD
jgi:tRNA threonylcarbamoyladenosine biosynthesis protein TsaE